MLSEDKRIASKILFYSYDIATHQIPEGIPEFNHPPTDRIIKKENEVK